MNLDQVTLEIRPRSAWEAVDLGLLMAKRWWLPMMKVWLLASLPFLLLALCIPAHYYWAAFLLLWWCKPLYERPLLYILSRAVFNELPSTRSTLKLFPGLALKHIFLSLSIRRFSPTRCMDLPVLQLEGLAGARRQERLGVLHREDASPAGWLSFIGLLLEIFLALGMMSIIWSMIPAEIEIEWANFFIDQDNTQLLQLKIALWYCALGLSAPFYVACGFALYLNRRVKLEAWDIDIAFRRIANKRSANATLVSLLGTLTLALGLWLLAPPETAYADDQLPAMSETASATPDYVGEAVIDKPLGDYTELQRDSAAQAIKDVLQQNEFSRKEIRRTLKLDEPEEEEDEELTEFWENFFESIGDFKGLVAAASLVEILLWLGVLALIAVVIYRYRGWLAAQFVRVKHKPLPRTKPITLFGMDVTHESLPADISQSALALLNAGNQRAALALLYRASLFQLIHSGVDIHDGHTEGECVQLMRDHFSDRSIKHGNNDGSAIGARIDYFAQLTRLWQQLAYGHLAPEKMHAEQLCSLWNQCWLGVMAMASASNNQGGV